MILFDKVIVDRRMLDLLNKSKQVLHKKSFVVVYKNFFLRKNLQSLLVFICFCCFRNNLIFLLGTFI